MGKKGDFMSAMARFFSVISVFVIFPAVYGALVRLSALILKYQRITWRQGFIFGLLAVICSSLIRAVLFGTGYSLPLVPGILLGLLVNWGIGSWFFSRQGADNEGGRLGWEKSVKLTGLTLVMLCILVALLVTVPVMLIHQKSG